MLLYFCQNKITSYRVLSIEYRVKKIEVGSQVRISYRINRISWRWLSG